MPTNLKAEARARQRATGEKYTAARRAVLNERRRTTAAALTTEVVVHLTRNGLDQAEECCEATTVKGRQCRNPYIYGQIWSGGAHEQVIPDSQDARMLAQRRCAVHVDHDQHAQVRIVMDDVPKLVPVRGRMVWQDTTALAAIRQSATGGELVNAIALYVAFCELAAGPAHIDGDPGSHAGLSPTHAQAAKQVLETAGVLQGDQILR